MTNPLRKIVGSTRRIGSDQFYDVLECGHEMLEANGIYGRENRIKRRCRECGKKIKSASVVLAVDPSVAATKKQDAFHV